MSDFYLTPATPHQAEIEVKRSRFLCDLVPVDDETQARAQVEAARRTHWDARHHCSAFVLGPEATVRRSSDDGEPSGTAGMPMLDVLLGAGLTDVVAVVTRWFGGTLLGTGGLVKAYSDAVRAALHGASIDRYERMVTLQATVPVADAGRIEHALRTAGAVIRDVTYGQDARLEVACTAAAQPTLERALAESTSGRSSFETGPSVWVKGR